MQLADKSIWTIPITLDVPHAIHKKALDADKLYLRHAGRDVGYMEIQDCYKIDARHDVMSV
jgi:ATP sulfurylase